MVYLDARQKVSQPDDSKYDYIYFIISNIDDTFSQVFKRAPPLNCTGLDAGFPAKIWFSSDLRAKPLNIMPLSTPLLQYRQQCLFLLNRDRSWIHQIVSTAKIGLSINRCGYFRYKYKEYLFQ
jgi:hypothetical protein